MAEAFRIPLTARAETALHLTGPGRTLALVDRPLQVDHDGRPVLPGSSVRGRVRAQLERLLRGLGLPVCTPPRPERMCPRLRDEYCLACRIFGSPDLEAAVRVDDLRCEGVDETLPQRTNVSLSRRLGTAQGERLFVSETTPWRAGTDHALTFHGQLSGRAGRTELGWLLAAIRLVTHVGGSKARGLGRVRLEAETVEWWDAEDGTWRSEASGRLISEVLDDAS
jgi:CRISPR/Cas system CSM-associated protein Csm3 (group 7 of RAMP superfamily)